MAVTQTPAAAKSICEVTEEETEAKGEALAGPMSGKFMLPLHLNCFPDFSHHHLITTAQTHPHFTTVPKAVAMLQSVF